VTAVQLPVSDGLVVVATHRLNVPGVLKRSCTPPYGAAVRFAKSTTAIPVVITDVELIQNKIVYCGYTPSTSRALFDTILSSPACGPPACGVSSTDRGYGQVAMTVAMQMPSKRPLVPDRFDAKP